MRAGQGRAGEVLRRDFNFSEEQDWCRGENVFRHWARIGCHDPHDLAGCLKFRVYPNPWLAWAFRLGGV